MQAANISVEPIGKTEKEYHWVYLVSKIVQNYIGEKGCIYLSKANWQNL